MGKKIIVLNGSPRRGGNTAALVDRFLQGAKEAGHQVTRFDLRDMEIHLSRLLRRRKRPKQSLRTEGRHG